MRTLSSLMSSTSPADAISDTPPAPAISTLLFSEVTLSGPKQEMEVITCLCHFCHCADHALGSEFRHICLLLLLGLLAVAKTDTILAKEKWSCY